MTSHKTIESRIVTTQTSVALIERNLCHFSQSLDCIPAQIREALTLQVDAKWKIYYTDIFLQKKMYIPPKQSYYVATRSAHDVKKRMTDSFDDVLTSRMLFKILHKRRTYARYISLKTDLKSKIWIPKFYTKLC